MDYLIVGDQPLRIALLACQLLLLSIVDRCGFVFGMKRSRVLVALIGAHTVTRLAAFLLLYVFIGIDVPGDIRAFFKPWADAAAAGALPYSEIKTPFSPLFPYLLAAIAKLGSSKAIVFFFLSCDVIGFAVWASIAELWFGRVVLIRMAVIYALNPEIVGAAIGGQDEPLAILFAGLIVALILRKREGFAGALGALLLLATKCFSGIYILSVLACSRSRRRFLLGFAIAGIPPLLYFLGQGVDVLYPLVYVGEPNERWSPGNIYFLFSIAGFDIDGHRFTATLILAVGLISLALFISTARRSPDLMLVTSLFFLVFSLISFKSWYLPLAAPFLAIVASRKTSIWPMLAIVALHGLASVNASAWYEWMRFGSLDLLWQKDLPDPLHRTSVALFAVLQLAEVSLKAVLVGVFTSWCWRERAQSSKPAGAPLAAVAR